LSYLPIPVLGGVVFVSVLSLIDVKGMRAMWRLRPSEGAIGLIAMSGVILYGTLVGVAIAVLLAALNIVRRAARPEILEEGRLADGSWHDLSRSLGARRVEAVRARKDVDLAARDGCAVDAHLARPGRGVGDAAAHHPRLRSDVVGPDENRTREVQHLCHGPTLAAPGPPYRRWSTRPSV